MSIDNETDEYEEDFDEELEEEDRPWESFKISEEQWDAIWKQVQHANIDTDTVADLFLACFPDPVTAARAYACFSLLSEIDEEW